MNKRNRIISLSIIILHGLCVASQQSPVSPDDKLTESFRWSPVVWGNKSCGVTPIEQTSVRLSSSLEHLTVKGESRGQSPLLDFSSSNNSFPNLSTTPVIIKFVGEQYQLPVIGEELYITSFLGERALKLVRQDTWQENEQMCELFAVKKVQKRSGVEQVIQNFDYQILGVSHPDSKRSNLMRYIVCQVLADGQLKRIGYKNYITSAQAVDEVLRLQK